MVDKTRACFVAAGAIFAVFVADILIAKIQVVRGATIPVHVGDVGQFLLLLVAVTFFVAGALLRERSEAGKDQ